MLFVLLAVAGGLLFGWLLGGSLTRLEATRLRRVWVIVVAFALQVVAAFALTDWAYAGALVASLLVALVWLVINPSLAGRGLIGLGLAANALVIVANGAMPVVLTAAAEANVATGPLADDPRHTIEDSSTHVHLLDDRIPLALPWQPQVLSVGDVCVAAGVGLMVCQAMRRRIVPEISAPPGTTTRPEVLFVPPPGRPPSQPQANSD